MGVAARHRSGNPAHVGRPSAVADGCGDRAGHRRGPADPPGAPGLGRHCARCRSRRRRGLPQWPRLTTRHVVRGHWTHQPYGPKRQLRRLQWVAPFIRGPQEAPFVGTDTVTCGGAKQHTPPLGETTMNVIALISQARPLWPRGGSLFSEGESGGSGPAPQGQARHAVSRSASCGCWCRSRRRCRCRRCGWWPSRWWSRRG